MSSCDRRPENVRQPSKSAQVSPASTPALKGLPQPRITGACVIVMTQGFDAAMVETEQLIPDMYRELVKLVVRLACPAGVPVEAAVEWPEERERQAQMG